MENFCAVNYFFGHKTYFNDVNHEMPLINGPHKMPKGCEKPAGITEVVKSNSPRIPRNLI